MTLALNDQQRRGEIAPSFEVQREEREFYNKFRLEGRDIHGKFSDPQMSTGVKIYDWYEGAIRDLHSKICNNSNQDDFVGVTVHFANFSNGSIWMSLRRVKDLSFMDL